MGRPLFLAPLALAGCKTVKVNRYTPEKASPTANPAVTYAHTSTGQTVSPGR